MTWKEAIDSASKKLEGKISDAARNVEYLALHILQLWNRTEIRKFYGTTLSPEEEAKYHEVVSRRLKQEPLQHITGETEFFGLRFFTSPAALIPRPDTEILVEEALIEAARFSKVKLQLLDIGTGSGIIALAIASKIPSVHILGIDISEDSLKLAEKNRERLGISNSTFEQIDIFSDQIIEKLRSSKIDILVSNPPYISANEVDSLDIEVRNFDPRNALTDESDGLSFYKRIAEISPELLSAGARIIIEIGFGMAEKVEEIFSGSEFTVLRVVKDLQGIDRVIVIQFQ